MSSLTHESDLADALERALGDRDGVGLLEGELEDLFSLAETLEASASEVVPSQDFRAAARHRLLIQMARSARAAGQVPPIHPLRLWVARFAAGLTALSFAGAAAATAAASALPGDALYVVKQATEAVAIQLATTDSARQDILLQQADTRLDETARLLEQGRDADAAVAAARYDETVARLDVPAASPHSEVVQSNLRTNEIRLSELLQTAPAPAQHGLERALAATERGLARSRASAPVPTVGVTPVATITSEQRLTDVARAGAAAVETSPAADADERGARESHDSTNVTPRGRGVEHRAEATPVNADADAVVEVTDSSPPLPIVESSSDEPRGNAVSESRAASRAATPSPSTSQPPHGLAPTRPKPPVAPVPNPPVVMGETEPTDA